MGPKKGHKTGPLTGRGSMGPKKGRKTGPLTGRGTMGSLLRLAGTTGRERNCIRDAHGVVARKFQGRGAFSPSCVSVCTCVCLYTRAHVCVCVCVCVWVGGSWGDEGKGEGLLKRERYGGFGGGLALITVCRVGSRRWWTSISCCCI
jgi:hypothetical protein